MTVVCKMQCYESPTGEAATNESVGTVRLGAVYEPDEGQRQLPENAVFGKWTPWGEFKAGIGNPAAKQFFTPGKKYYITFTEAPD